MSTESEQFSRFLASKGYPGKWGVSQRLTPNMRAKGYEHAISQAKYSALEAEFERITGHEAAREAAAYEKRYGVRLADQLANGRRTFSYPKVFSTESWPAYFECGQCSHLHARDLPGHVDCRDDRHRFTADDLDARHGRAGWKELTLDEQTENNHFYS